MIEVAIHPGVFATGTSKGLLGMLERAWIRELNPGNGTVYLFSGFGNYNGGVRFYKPLREHVERGGKVEAFFAGSSAQRLTSKQVVTELLSCGANVSIVNRKRLVHMKSYGLSDSKGDQLIVTSGNFTGPGMSQNVEMSVYFDRDATRDAGFRWSELSSSFRSQSWDVYEVKSDPSAAVWRLLYDEAGGSKSLDEAQDMTLVMTLSHADTARVNAPRGSDAGKGTQYFWLSKDCFDFFPPLTIPNSRGAKATYSCLVRVAYPDLGIEDESARVTFEAENNFDFRFGTAPLRHTNVCAEGDLALISRRGEDSYEVRFLKQDSQRFANLAPFATTFIGGRGKRYGYISNAQADKLMT